MVADNLSQHGHRKRWDRGGGRYTTLSHGPDMMPHPCLCSEVGHHGPLRFVGASGAPGFSWLGAEDGVFLLPGVCAESDP